MPSGARIHGYRTAFVEIGSTRWRLPIPIVGSVAGWSFDTRGAAEELRMRRIGPNELAAINVALAFTDVQEEYQAMDPDGDGVKTFATRILSSKARRSGLYWPAKCGDTGVMTFVVNRDGTVHEKDLGPRTVAIARAMKAYDPDPGWEKSNLPRD